MVQTKQKATQNQNNNKPFIISLILGLIILNGLIAWQFLSNRNPLTDHERSAYALANQGNEAFDAGHFTEAITYYSEAIDLLPPDAALLYNRGLAYMSLNETGLALQDFQIAIEVNNRYEPPYLILGDIYDQREDYTIALSYYQTYINLVGNDGFDAPRVIIRIAELENSVEGD